MGETKIIINFFLVDAQAYKYTYKQTNKQSINKKGFGKKRKL